MEQATIENNLNSMSSLDSILTSGNHDSSLSTAEIDRFIYDSTLLESLHEIDFLEPDMLIRPDGSYLDLFEGFNESQEPSVQSLSHDDTELPFSDDFSVVHPIESNDMAERFQTGDEQLAMIKPSDDTTPIIRQPSEKSSTISPFVPPIPLSNSVAVTESAANQLQIIRPLEDSYRPRYKSDYFPQSGSPRLPRYVADNKGNHFVTVKIPNEYKLDLRNTYICAALITVSIEGRGHFYSPYKFQTNHRDAKVPDENPIYLPVEKKKNNSTIELKLVLIKSKLDQLNDAQPLKRFPDGFSIKNIINEEKLSPKELINTYQLDKSHIAFTLCTKLPNGSFEMHHETRVISSILTELPSKPAKASTSRTQPTTQPTENHVRCPSCSHIFNPNDPKSSQVTKKRQPNSTASGTCSSSTNTNSTSKRKKIC